VQADESPKAKRDAEQLSGSSTSNFQIRYDPVDRINTMRIPTAHLISGLPCSGKTTYAKVLRERTGGILLSLDYWLITMYGRYSLDHIGYPEHVRRVLACRQLISDIACEFLRHGVDVILDDGFFLREHRLQQITSFGSVVIDREATAPHVRTHVVCVALDVSGARLEDRNANLPKHNFAVTPDMLQRFVTIYEAPASDEGPEVVHVDGTVKETLARNAE
jgi:predicted kinase